MSFPFIILSISESINFQDIHEISSIIEGFNESVVVNRCIEFPQEYYQAGLGILSYFNKILKEKYPDTPAKIKIIQDDLLVKMIIETKDGKKEIIEKALEEYALIIKGDIKPDEYFSSASQIIELRNELRIMQIRVENKKILLI